MARWFIEPYKTVPFQVQCFRRKLTFQGRVYNFLNLADTQPALLLVQFYWDVPNTFETFKLQNEFSVRTNEILSVFIARKMLSCFVVVRTTKETFLWYFFLHNLGKFSWTISVLSPKRLCFFRTWQITLYWFCIEGIIKSRTITHYSIFFKIKKCAMDLQESKFL